MRKEAIGIAINGREVKIAHVFRDKHRLGVDFLESSFFTADIDVELKKKVEQRSGEPIINEEEDIFVDSNPHETKSPLEKETGIRENIDILYSLLAKYTGRKIKIAFNISPSRVTYQELDTHLDYNPNVFKGTLRKKIEEWKKGFNALDNVSVITRKDGTLCNVACETYQPPILDILEQLNTFFKGNLFLTLMDPNDVSLVNLARIGYDFRDPNKYTAIVEIETEFSRIIFMKGEDLLAVSPIINESFNPDIINIVYSKINYELDNSNIPEISNILLAGRASSFANKTFFEKKFPDTRVGFIISQPLAGNLSSQFNREDLSSYAIPIALAWKVVDSKNNNFIPTNLLPAQIIDRQKVLTLSFVGYLVLILLGITAFITTWKIAAKKIEVRELKKNNSLLQERIDSTEETVKRVHQLEEDIIKLKTQIILSDSLSYGSDRWSIFLEKLNQCVSKIKSVWIEEVKNTKNGILIKGMAFKRVDVPRMSEELGGAKIRKLIRAGSESRRIYAFEMEADWTLEPLQPKFKNSVEPEKVFPMKTASTESKTINSKTSDWGTSTVVTQTVIGEEDMGVKHEQETIISNQQSETVVAFNDNNNVDRFANMENSSKKFENKNEHNSVTRTKIESNDTPEISYQENYISHNESRSLSEDNSHFTIKISAHASKFTAKKEIEFYRSKGFNTYITTLPNSNHEIPYWVCLGDFTTYDEAQNELNKLNRVVPGKRIVIEVSEDRIVNHISPPPSLQSQQRVSINRRANNRMIKKANHTDVSNQNDQMEDQQILNDSDSKYYIIRISAHVTKFTANKEVEFYKSKGYDTYVTKLPNSSRDIPYSVCLGNFESHIKAQEKIKELVKIIPRNYVIAAINK